MAKPPTTKPIDWKAAHAARKLKWSVKSESQTKGVYPNKLGWIIDQPEIGALIVVQGETDFALGKNGLDYQSNAIQEGRIKKSFVVLMDREYEIVGVAPLEDVIKLVSGVEPRPGQWGPYWWITADFRLANTSPPSPY
jgi:hypothetical protein